MLSRMPAGVKNGIIGVQVWTSTSRVTRSAAMATARLSPGVTLRGGELRIVVDILDDQRAHRIVEQQHHRQDGASPQRHSRRLPLAGAAVLDSPDEQIARVPRPDATRKVPLRTTCRGPDRMSWRTLAFAS